MRRSQLFVSFLLLAFFCQFTPLNGAELVRRAWKIDGVEREALLHLPQTPKGAPVVFGFHGHGGSMRNGARMFHIETLWPEAVVVYMQGVPTPGHITDFEGKLNGWQKTVGDQNDRDLKFFDAVLATLKKEYNVDSKRVYATGHSNGGAFSYLLWEARGDQFAGFAPSACAFVSLLDNAERRAALLKTLNAEDRAKYEPVLKKRPDRDVKLSSKPVLHIAGTNDPLVKFAWQLPTIAGVRQLNQCGKGIPWPLDKSCTLYPSEVKADVVTYIHSGTHKYPEEAPEIIVKFFKSLDASPTKAR